MGCLPAAELPDSAKLPFQGWAAGEAPIFSSLCSCSVIGQAPASHQGPPTEFCPMRLSPGGVRMLGGGVEREERGAARTNPSIPSLLPLSSFHLTEFIENLPLAENPLLLEPPWRKLRKQLLFIYDFTRHFVCVKVFHYLRLIIFRIENIISPFSNDFA